MFKKCLLLLIAVSATGFIISCDSGNGNGIILTEVSTDGDVGGLTTDYIELYNSSSEDIDLTGYYIGDDTDELYEVPVTVELNVWDADSSSWISGDSESVGAPAVVPARGYLIILFSNDFAIDDVVSKTTLPESWIDGEDTQTVNPSFAGETYLTIPAGLKGNKAEGVYIYEADGETQAANTFTYEADEQEDDKVFLFDGKQWSQGAPSPGADN